MAEKIVHVGALSLIACGIVGIVGIDGIVGIEGIVGFVGFGVQCYRLLAQRGTRVVLRGWESAQTWLANIDCRTRT